MLRTIWVLVVAATSTPILAFVAALTCTVYPRSYMTMRAGRLWAWLILRASGVRVEYEGLAHATARSPRVFIANHQSMFDIFVTALKLPAPTLYVAKQSMFRIPLVGWAMAASGFIFVDRRDRGRAIRSLERAAARIRAGRSVALFAEGTRSRTGRLQPFKRGPFHLALRAGVPVVPLAISGSWSRLRPGSLRVRPGTIRVRFAPPLDPGRYRPDDVRGLMNAVRRAIVERLEPFEVEPSPAAATTGGR